MNHIEEIYSALERLTSSEARAVVIRLALLPHIRAEGDWQRLKPVILEGIDQAKISFAELDRILDKSLPFLSFGSEAQHQSVRRWLAGIPQPELLHQMEWAVGCLAQDCGHLLSTIGEAAEGIQGFGLLQVLSLLGAEWKGLSVPEWLIAISDAAASSLSSLSGAKNQQGSHWSLAVEKEAIKRIPASKQIFAIAWGNRFSLSKGGEELRGELLETLWSLYEEDHENQVLRDNLAIALQKSCRRAIESGTLEHARALIGKLESLIRSRPDDQGVCEQFAFAASELCEAHLEEGDLKSAVRTLREMAPYCERIKTELVLERLAEGLCNMVLRGLTRTWRNEEAAYGLEELRRLSENWPDRDEVLSPLGRALAGTYNVTEEAGERRQADQILGELSSLYQRHPRNTSVRLDLSIALYNRCLLRKRIRDVQAVESALDELRRIGYGDSESAVNLAEGLRTRFLMAEEDGNLLMCDGLLAELRDLVKLYPDKTPVAMQLALALCNRILDAMEEGDPPSTAILRRELLALAVRYPQVDRQLRQMGWFPPYGGRI